MSLFVHQLVSSLLAFLCCVWLTSSLSLYLSVSLDISTCICTVIVGLFVSVDVIIIIIWQSYDAYGLHVDTQRRCVSGFNSCIQPFSYLLSLSLSLSFPFPRTLLLVVLPPPPSTLRLVFFSLCVL